MHTPDFGTTPDRSLPSFELSNSTALNNLGNINFVFSVETWEGKPMKIQAPIRRSLQLLRPSIRVHLEDNQTKRGTNSLVLLFIRIPRSQHKTHPDGWNQANYYSD